MIQVPEEQVAFSHLPRSLRQVEPASLGKRVLIVMTMAITNKTMAIAAASSARPVRYPVIPPRRPRNDGKEPAGMVA